MLPPWWCYSLIVTFYKRLLGWIVSKDRGHNLYNIFCFFSFSLMFLVSLLLNKTKKVNIALWEASGGILGISGERTESPLRQSPQPLSKPARLLQCDVSRLSGCHWTVNFYCLFLSNMTVLLDFSLTYLFFFTIF